MSRFKSILSVILCFAITLPVFAQTPEIKGRTTNAFFSRLAKDYLPTPVAHINFEDSARIDRLIRAGRIYLSLRDAIALALENNLDIEVARLNPKLQQANLQDAPTSGSLRQQGVGFLEVDRDGFLYQDIQTLCERCRCYLVVRRSRHAHRDRVQR